ncbi:hypothetical protein LPJ53_003595 [Coemansia erecta]|uniref:Inhibitor I9 domain-containing protein n=1 Tax=Coemansia erecta TaxID=147472 RepID=A0A9W8CSK9_9FUNG|nr:hypothetical protein LPJ53_003595 [Coemansia erecta]
MPDFRRLSTLIKRPFTKKKASEMSSSSTAKAETKSYSVKIADNVEGEELNKVKANIEAKVKSAGGTARYSELIKTYMVEIPVQPAEGMVAISSKDALASNLGSEGIEFVDEEGTVTTQN